MGSTLVVVDMQKSFRAAHNPYTLNNVVREIKKSRLHKSGIVIVQYDQGGILLNEIHKAVKNYNNVDFVIKNSDDGSDEVCNSIMDNFFDYQKLRVCGVNTDACVQSTVEGLSEKLPNATIELVADACNSNVYCTFDWVKYLPNVTLKEENE